MALCDEKAELTGVGERAVQQHRPFSFLSFCGVCAITARVSSYNRCEFAIAIINYEAVLFCNVVVNSCNGVLLIRWVVLIIIPSKLY